MSPQNIAGIVLLAVGIILFVMGMNASNSFVDQANEALTGRYTDKTTWYIIGGAASGLIGLMLVLVGMRKKHA